MKTLLPKILLAFVCLTLYCCTINDKVAFENSFQFEYVDPLEKVLTETSYFPEKEALSEVVRGEHATLQFIVRSAESIRDLRVEVSAATKDGKNLPEAKTGFVGYVKVGRSVWDFSRDRIVSTSGYYPDPILDQESIDVNFGNTQPIWVSIPIPINAEPGLYEGNVTITGLNGKTKFKLSKAYSVKVYPAFIDKTTLWVTNWFFTDPERLRLLNGGNAVELYSDEYFRLVKLLANKMAEYRQNVALLSPIGLSSFTWKKGKWKTDFTNFDKMVNLFIDTGVIGRIEGGHIGGREGGWNSQFVVSVPKDTINTKELISLPMSDKRAQQFYTDFISALNNHVKEKGWSEIYMQHIADEPTEFNYATYIEIAKFVKKLAPEFKFIEACHSRNLEGMLDIWVPQLDYADKDYEFYKTQTETGKEAWMYTCLNPKGEYANRFIELPLLKTRYVHWLNYKYNFTGYLHWGLNYWNSDPYAEQTGIQYEGGNILPGGDSWIVYPAEGRVLSSIRYDAMRDGIVDYELFKMLERKNPEKARELVNKVIFSFTRYDNNLSEFRKHRRTLMELLSE